MRLGRRLDPGAAEMGAPVALYPHDGPAVIGTLLAVRARAVVLAPWGRREVIVLPRDRVEMVRVVEVVREHERDRICMKQRGADYGFLEHAQPERPRRPRQTRRTA
ncbi:MAG: hypothetical protein IPM35_27985 [Myxococcales bacterium]|nr:hypothetical protein [Myxococcales bacterium]